MLKDEQTLHQQGFARLGRQRREEVDRQTRDLKHDLRPDQQTVPQAMKFYDRLISWPLSVVFPSKCSS